MSKPRKADRVTEPAWGTASERIKWLVERKFDGNRSALAKAIGFSHAIVGRVVAGTKPGRRFLEAVVRHLHVNPSWMEHGEGQPFSEVGGDDRGIPVTNVLLPGPPAAHQSMVLEWLAVSEVVQSPSVYWLVLKSSQPVAKGPSSGFRTGDQLLMETDPTKFPKESELSNDLCVVRGGTGDTDLKLATITHYKASVDDGPARLEADYHDTAKRGSEDQTVVESVYRHHPNGDIEHFQRRYTRVPDRGDRLGMEPGLPLIRYSDIIAVWRKLLRRPL
jgi:hypothetical protein